MLKNSLSKALVPAGVEGPCWQRGYYDNLLRSGESYSQQWDYVRENSMRAGLVKMAPDWPLAEDIHDLEYHK